MKGREEAKRRAHLLPSASRLLMLVHFTHSFFFKKKGEFAYRVQEVQEVQGDPEA